MKITDLLKKQSICLDGKADSKEQPHGMEISAEQFYQLLGGEPKHDKEK